MTTEWQPLQSALIVPIVHEGDLLGTINLYHPHADAFGEHDRQLLETIAQRIGTALYNGLLFDRTRTHAFTDPVTGLYNLRFITLRIEDLCRRAARRARQDRAEAAQSGVAVVGQAPASEEPAADRFALLCVDLDSFKAINDDFGHQRGDEVLRNMGRVLRGIIGPAGIVARYGGDELLVLLHDAGPDEAESAAIRIQAAVEAYDACLTTPRSAPSSSA